MGDDPASLQHAHEVRDAGRNIGAGEEHRTLANAWRRQRLGPATRDDHARQREHHS